MAMLMMKRDSIGFVSRSGEMYEFQTYPWGHEFEILPAVYVVAERRAPESGNADYRILYIGETMNLSTEFSRHRHLDSLLARNANTIGVLLDPDAESRIALVRELSGTYLRGSDRY